MRDMPWYLLDLVIRGFEGDGDDGGDDDGGDDSEDDDSEDSDDSEDDSDDEEDDDKSAEKNIDGLKKALREERLGRKKAERELKKKNKAEQRKSTEEASELEETKARKDELEGAVERLAGRVRKDAVDNLIIKHATAAKFRDVDDALNLVSRDDIDVDQDEDDPSQIEIDEDSVEAAIKSLAKKKPHLLLAEGDGSPTGSKFKGKSKDKGQLDDDAIRSRYSALRKDPVSS